MKTTTLKPKELKSKHRAVAPVIATLLMVAIAVVGGTIIFVFAQGFFSSSQISGTPTIESIKILGYDATDATQLVAENQLLMFTPNSGGNANNLPELHERIAVYIQNDSTSKTIISKLTVAGSPYVYAQSGTLDAFGAASSIVGGEFDILKNTDGLADTMVDTPTAEIQAGEAVTVLIALDGPYKLGRDSQFNLETANGAKFVGTIVFGQQCFSRYQRIHL